MRELGDDERLAYQRDGVIKVAGAVPAGTAAEMLEAVDRLLASPRAAGGTGMDRHLHPHLPEFRAFLYGTDLPALTAQATGSDTIRAYFEQVFVKDPGTDRVFHWHQDHPFWPIEGTQVASTWVALTASSVAASALEFVLGSHRWGRTYQPYFEGPADREALNQLWDGFGDHVLSLPDQIEAFEEHPERYTVAGFDVEPGDALLFDYRILHRSRGNGSPRRRVAVSWRWLGDDATWAPDPGTDPVISQADTWLQPGQRIIDDETFPVVYRAGAPLRA